MDEPGTRVAGPQSGEDFAAGGGRRSEAENAGAGTGHERGRSAGRQEFLLQRGQLGMAGKNKFFEAVEEPVRDAWRSRPLIFNRNAHAGIRFFRGNAEPRVNQYEPRSRQRLEGFERIADSRGEA